MFAKDPKMPPSFYMLPLLYKVISKVKNALMMFESLQDIPNTYWH